MLVFIDAPPQTVMGIIGIYQDQIHREKRRPLALMSKVKTFKPPEVVPNEGDIYPYDNARTDRSDPRSFDGLPSKNQIKV